MSAEHRSEARGVGYQRVTDAMHEGAVPAKARDVARAMLLRTNPDGSAWHSVSLLARDMDRSAEYVRAGIRVLRDNGLLWTVSPGGAGMPAAFRYPSGKHRGKLMEKGQAFWCFPLVAEHESMRFAWVEWVLTYTRAGAIEGVGWEKYVPASLAPSIFPSLMSVPVNEDPAANAVAR